MKARDITVLALMAACNAALELTVGTWLHSLRFPLTGTIMGGLNLLPYTLGYRRVPRPGAILMMGVVTAFLHVVLAGTWKVMALPAIVMEAAVLDVLISGFGLRKSAVVGGGVSVSICSFAWSLFTARVFLGRDLYATLLRYVGSNPLMADSLMVLLVVVLAFHALCGLGCGVFAWRVLGLVAAAEVHRRPLRSE